MKRLMSLSAAIVSCLTCVVPIGSSWPRLAGATPGDLDATFHSTGYLRAGLGPAQNRGNAVIAQADLKVVVAGSCINGFDSDFSTHRYNTDGSLDGTFGTGGKVATSFSLNHDYGRCVTIQADDKIVVGGDASGQMALARYNPNGTLDPTFGGDGRVTVGAVGTCLGNAITGQPDGKLVLAGSTILGSAVHLAVARFLPDGSLDPSFGAGGIVNTSLFDWEAAEGITYQPDGKLVVVGTGHILGNTVLFVARYTASGVLDTSFDSDGYATVEISPETEGYAVAIQNSLTDPTKIVAVGTTGSKFNHDFLIVRFNFDGSLDSSFGVGGIVTTDFSGAWDEAHSVWIQYTGATPNRILVGGYGVVASGDFAVARYNLNGTLDATFDGDGRTNVQMSHPSGPNQNDGVTGMIRSVGRIVLVGYAYGNQQDLECAIARLNDTGALDGTFDLDGKRLEDAGSTIGSARSVLVQPDGRIVTAGNMSGATGDDFAVFRCLADGTPDMSFNGGAWSKTAIGPYDDEVAAVARLSDGKLLVAGYSALAGETSVVLVRYNADGTNDSGFGTGSIVVHHVGGMSLEVADMAIQPDGRILVAATTVSEPWGIVVARFESDGAPDPTFGIYSGHTAVFLGYGGAANAMTLQSDGKIVIAGRVATGPGDDEFDFLVLRFDADGALDPSFGASGSVITLMGSEFDEATDVAVEANGKILVAGSSEIGADKTMALARYNGDGSLDTSFDSDGRVFLTIPNYVGTAALAIQANGRIVVAGSQLNPPPQGSDFVVARFQSNGGVDASYGNGGTTVLDIDGGSVDLAQGLALDGEGQAVLVGGSSGLFSIARLLGDDALTDVGQPDGRVSRAALLVEAPRPNPTTLGTTIRFRTSESGPLTALLVDVTGRHVRSIADKEPRSAGEHLLRWDGQDDSGNAVASGIYFIRVRHGSASGGEKITVIR